MEKPEIIAGLKHAVERGYSLDVAISSFINAGYNIQDVQDSARSIGGAMLTPSQPQPVKQQVIQAQPKPIQPIQQPRPQPAQQQIQQIQKPEYSIQPKKTNSKIGLIVFLVIVLALLVAGLLALIFAKQQVLDLLSKIGLQF